MQRLVRIGDDKTIVAVSFKHLLEAVNLYPETFQLAIQARLRSGLERYCGIVFDMFETDENGLIFEVEKVQHVHQVLPADLSLLPGHGWQRRTVLNDSFKSYCIVLCAAGFEQCILSRSSGIYRQRIPARSGSPVSRETAPDEGPSRCE